MEISSCPASQTTIGVNNTTIGRANIGICAFGQPQAHEPCRTAKAQAIVDYRQAHGPFSRPDDLAKVKGIGSRVVDQNQGNILVSDPESKPRKK